MGQPETFHFDHIGCVHSWGNRHNPLVVLSHGFMQTGTSWAPIAEQLATKYWVLAPDLLGHGQTAFIQSENLSLEDYVDQLHSLISWAKNEQQPAQTAKPALIGYSLGGRIAALYTIKFTETVSCLILESAGLGPENEEERVQRAQKTARMIERLEESVAQNPDKPLAAFVDFWEQLPLFESQLDLPEYQCAAIRAERLANNPAALRANLVQAGQDKMPNLRLPIAAANIPVLYLVGERDVAYTKTAQSLMRAWAEAHETLPEVSPAEQGFVQVNVVSQAGHNIHLERPEEYAAHVMAFLSRTL